MTENNYGEPDFNITPEPDTSYVHPVLTQLNDKIANLEKQLADQRSRNYELSSNFANYKFKLENVLRTHAQEFEGTVIETCVSVADEMGIELTNTKDFEINVTFNVTVSAPFGEEIEISEYDISATLDSVGVDDFEVNDIGVVYIQED